jgi:hypothetical protein
LHGCGVGYRASDCYGFNPCQSKRGHNKRKIVTVTVKPREYLRKIEAEVNTKEAESYGAKSKRRPKPKERSAMRWREEVKSPTDSDSGLLGRPGEPKGFRLIGGVSPHPAYKIKTSALETAKSLRRFSLRLSFC